MPGASPDHQERVYGFADLRRLPRSTIVAVLCVVAVGSTVAFIWRDLIDIHQPFDPVLAGLWVGMTLLLGWRVRPRRDLVLATSAFAGGFMIEWWGTTTELWTYFTFERPPLWIIPAWPVAALATDRLAFLSDRLVTRLLRRNAQPHPSTGDRAPTRASWPLRIACILVLAAFIAAMIRFMLPAISITSSRVVIAIMIGVALTTQNARRDLLLFFAGTALGWLLEYWGTTRECWTYYTQQTPPLETAFAHGFASVAFARASTVLAFVADRVLPPRPSPELRSTPSPAGTRGPEPLPDADPTP